MQLEMRRESEGHLAQDLPVGDDEVYTGDMGDCVSIVVLWNHNGETFDNVRGFHGGGGLSEINLGSLFAGVPAGGHGAVIYGFIGTTAKDSRDLERFKSLVLNGFQDGGEGFQDAGVRAYITPHAWVYRNGFIKLPDNVDCAWPPGEE